MKYTALILSLFVHGIFLSLLYKETTCKLEPTNIVLVSQKATSAPTINEPKHSSPRSISKHHRVIDESKKRIVTKGYLGGNCKESYGGLGVYYNGVAITGVMPGYPGEAIGLLPGDIILTQGDLRGPIGSSVDIEVLRQGRPIHFTAIREKICIE